MGTKPKFGKPSEELEEQRRKGGIARAKNLSAKELSAISKKGNKARWASEEQHRKHSEALKASWARRRANAAEKGAKE